MKRILKKNQLIIAALAVMNFWIFLMKMLPVLPGISKARTAMKAK